MITSKEEIKKWLDLMTITYYTINPDLSVDVNADVFIYSKQLKEIPIQFRTVNGNFRCSCNNLTNLKGGPETVEGDYYCYKNNLSSLEGGPKIIGGGFYCSENNLTSLKGCPKIIKKDFDCSQNNLTSLKHCPEIIERDFDCSQNNLTSLKYCPKIIKRHFKVDKKLQSHRAYISYDTNEDYLHYGLFK